jgi:hypothetical protein
MQPCIRTRPRVLRGNPDPKRLFPHPESEHERALDLYRGAECAEGLFLVDVGPTFSVMFQTPRSGLRFVPLALIVDEWLEQNEDRVEELGAT